MAKRKPAIIGFRGGRAVAATTTGELVDGRNPATARVAFDVDADVEMELAHAEDSVSIRRVRVDAAALAEAERLAPKSPDETGDDESEPVVEIESAEESETRATYLVVPAGEEDDGTPRWEVRTPSGSTTFSRKADAVAAAVEIASADEPSELFIYGRDGRIQDRRTYGDDPAESVG